MLSRSPAASSLDLLLGDVRSLKQKRSRRAAPGRRAAPEYDVSAAEAGHLDLHRRALVGVAVVAADAAHCVEVLDACERLVAGRPELELLVRHGRQRGHRAPTTRRSAGEDE